ncbi:MAG TPA: polysaccharide pyruvyl transferase family protein, partial [Thermoanaerobaculia bacterium]|nr:polysaccharide pyruvyl transferase family protein [Thermoanaerobaculia bacterium]
MEQESAGGGAADVGAARIGLWGCFDAAIFGDLIAARVVEAELRRRSPGAEVRTFAPFGRLRPIPLDAGRLAEPFGPQTPARLSELSSELDAAFVGSGDLLTFDDTHFAAWYELPAGDLAPLRVGRWLIEGFGETEDRPALAWNALGVPHDLDRDGAVRVRAAARSAVYLSVRDERSRARLLAAGVEREITVVPEPALFARRVFSPAHLERRLAYLRAMEWFPRTGRALVVHVGEPLS